MILSGDKRANKLIFFINYEKNEELKTNIFIVGKAQVALSKLIQDGYKDKIKFRIFY